VKASMCTAVYKYIYKEGCSWVSPPEILLLVSAVASRWSWWYQKRYQPEGFFFLGTTPGGDLEHWDISNYGNISSLSRQYIFFSHNSILCKLKQVKNKVMLTVKTPLRHFYYFSGNHHALVAIWIFFLFQKEPLYF